MKYAGIRPTSGIPANAVSTELAYEEKHKGMTVQYWHVWVPDPNAVPPLFSDTDPATSQHVRHKIKSLDRLIQDGNFADNTFNVEL